jgi:hypothetical protein
VRMVTLVESAVSADTREFPTVPGPQTRPHRRYGDVAHALLILQGGFAIVATLGLVVIMGGSLVHMVVPLLHAVLLFTLAGLVARCKRWATVVTIVVECLTLVGVGFDALLGRFAAIDFTPTLVGLLTTIGLPIAVIVSCAQSVSER